MILSANFVAQY